MTMIAASTDKQVKEFEPLRSIIFSRPTPLSVGDAAIIDDDGRILLIQRADNQKWAMSGGALEVGETPAEGVVREALEETGIQSEPVALVGVFDSRLCGTGGPFHMYQFVFLCKPLEDLSDKPSHAHEVLDAHWFSEDALPEDLDTGHVSRIPEAFGYGVAKTELSSIVRRLRAKTAVSGSRSQLPGSGPLRSERAGFPHSAPPLNTSRG